MFSLGMMIDVFFFFFFFGGVFLNFPPSAEKG